MKAKTTSTGNDRVGRPKPSIDLAETDGATVDVTEESRSLREVEISEDEQANDDEKEQALPDEIRAKMEQEAEEKEEETSVTKSNRSRNDVTITLKSELKSLESKSRSNLGATADSPFRSQPGAIAVPGIAQDSAPIIRTKLPSLAEPGALSSVTRCSLSLPTQPEAPPSQEALQTLRPPSWQSNSNVNQSIRSTPLQGPNDDQSCSTFAAYTPRRHHSSISLGVGSFTSPPRSDASSSSSWEEAQDLEDGSISVLTTDDDTFACPRGNHFRHTRPQQHSSPNDTLHSRLDLSAYSSCFPYNNNDGDVSPVVVLAAVRVHDDEPKEPEESRPPMAHAKAAWSRRTLLVLVVALVVIVTAPLTVVWVLRGPHRDGDAQDNSATITNNETTTLDGFCNWGSDGTAASSVCEGGPQGGEYCNSGSRRCQEDCGGRWCAPCDSDSDPEWKDGGKWCPRPLSVTEGAADDIFTNTTTTGGFCNWGPDGTAATSMCEGGAHGTAFCNENSGHCQKECGGRWCMADHNGTMAPTPSPSVRPPGFCDWGPDGTGASSTCQQIDPGSDWCSESAANCEQHCNGNWCETKESSPDAPSMTPGER